MYQLPRLQSATVELHWFFNENISIVISIWNLTPSWLKYWLRSVKGFWTVIYNFEFSKLTRDWFQLNASFYTDLQWRYYYHRGNDFQIVNLIFVNITIWIKSCLCFVLNCQRFTRLTICLTSINGNIKKPSSAIYKLSTFNILKR